MWHRRDPPPNGHLQDAVAIAALTAAFNAHQVRCTEDKADIRRDQSEIKHTLADQNAEQLRMHGENKKEFRELAKEVARILKYVWIVVGAFGMLQFLAGGNGWGWMLLKAIHQ